MEEGEDDKRVRDWVSAREALMADVGPRPQPVTRITSPPSKLSVAVEGGGNRTPTLPCEVVVGELINVTEASLDEKSEATPSSHGVRVPRTETRKLSLFP